MDNLRIVISIFVLTVRDFEHEVGAATKLRAQRTSLPVKGPQEASIHKSREDRVVTVVVFLPCSRLAEALDGFGDVLARRLALALGHDGLDDPTHVFPYALEFELVHDGLDEHVELLSAHRGRLGLCELGEDRGLRPVLGGEIGTWGI